MELSYKEKIFMHGLYPKRLLQNPTLGKYLVFYAGLFELAQQDILKIENGIINIKDITTQDPVNDKIISFLLPLHEKKISSLYLTLARKASAVYKTQAALMLENHLLEKEDITFLSWKIGSRLKVRRPDKLRPAITTFERALIYGRKPEPENLALILLAGEGNLLPNFFPVQEYLRKAKKQYRQLIDSDILKQNQTIFYLRKTLRRSLNMQKIANNYSRV